MKKTLVALAVALFVFASCADQGASGADSKESLIGALRSLLESEAMTQTMSVESDTDSLMALGEGDIDEETAQKILDSSVVVSATQAENPEDATSLVVVNIAGSDDVELRFVEGDFYLRADVPNLMETFGQDPAQLDALSAQVQGQPGFEWVQPALAGEWLVIRDAIDLTEQLGATTVTGEQQKEVVNDLLRSVEQNATVSEEGEDDAGTHLQAALPMKQTLQDLVQSLGPAAGASGAQLEEQLQDIPNEDLIIDFWVDDDRVTQLGVDITQFEDLAAESGEEFPEGVDDLSLIIAFDEFDGEIEPVADAIEIDTQAIMQTLAGLMSGGAQSGGAPGGTGGFDCSSLKGAPPEVIELYAEECPELQS